MQLLRERSVEAVLGRSGLNHPALVAEVAASDAARGAAHSGAQHTDALKTIEASFLRVGGTPQLGLTPAGQRLGLEPVPFRDAAMAALAAETKAKAAYWAACEGNVRDTKRVRLNDFNRGAGIYRDDEGPRTLRRLHARLRGLRPLRNPAHIISQRAAAAAAALFVFVTKSLHRCRADATWPLVTQPVNIKSMHSAIDAWSSGATSSAADLYPCRQSAILSLRQAAVRGDVERARRILRRMDGRLEANQLTDVMHLLVRHGW
jgi:hypothetical protein